MAHVVHPLENIGGGPNMFKMMENQTNVVAHAMCTVLKQQTHFIHQLSDFNGLKK